jgi:sensor histidine kinase YesM
MGLVMTSYQFVQVVASLFGTYTIYKFICLFFAERRTSKRIEISAFIAYYFISLGLSWFASIPLLLLVANIGLFIALTFNYEATWKRRIACGLVVYVVLASVEIAVSVAAGYWGGSIFQKSQFDQSIALVIAKLLMYLIVLILEKLKRARQSQEVSTLHWLAIIAVPSITMYLLVLILELDPTSQSHVIVVVICILAINVLVFYLYDQLQLQGEMETERSLLQQQNKYFQRQFEMIQSNNKKMKAMRHDWKNQISVLSSMIKREDQTEAEAFIHELLANVEQGVTPGNTGNFVLDSILNYKIIEAEQKGIEVQSDVNVPENAELSSYDLTSLLGNLFDNAMEAVQNTQQEKQIKVKVKYTKGRMFISMSNPFEGEVKRENGLPSTTKANPKSHGMGLKQVKGITEKYHGEMGIATGNGQFQIKLFMHI